MGMDTSLGRLPSQSQSQSVSSITYPEILIYFFGNTQGGKTLMSIETGRDSLVSKIKRDLFANYHLYIIFKLLEPQ